MSGTGVTVSYPGVGERSDVDIGLEETGEPRVKSAKCNPRTLRYIVGQE